MTTRKDGPGGPEHEPEDTLGINAAQRLARYIYIGAIAAGIALGGLAAWFLSWLHGP